MKNLTRADPVVGGARFTPRNEQEAARLGPGGTDSRREVMILGTGVVGEPCKKHGGVFEFGTLPNIV